MTTLQMSPLWGRTGQEATTPEACGASLSLRCHAGFTTIEILVVMVVMGLLASLAAPSFTTFIKNTRLSTATTQLVSDLNLARSEAIKRNVHVLVCARNTAGTDCVANTDWRAGWVVCAEGATVNQCATGTATAPNPITVRAALSDELTLVYSNLTTTTATGVRFNSNSSQGSDGAANTLTVGGGWAGAVSRVVTISPAGNISKR